MKTYYTLITGASQGFGKSMSLEFAKRGMNLILVALPDSGLKKLSKFIELYFNVKVCYLELDLSISVSCYDILRYIEVNGLQVKYLVNNAGVLSRGEFSGLNEKYILKQIDVNVMTPTLLIRLLLNNLKSNGPAGILNISSMASFFTLPTKQVYGGTKAYLTSFSKSLAKELKGDNVSVTIICPGGLNTTTRLCYQNRLMGWVTQKSVLNPEEAATIAVDALFKKKNLVIPGFINKCLMFLDKLLPEFIKDKIAESEIKKQPVTV
ncbi:SDR family NAD(P)-dependent oxidoreductase [Aestuariibaculum marinum]|uniref:SDR family NAD(P)-dependent oxidoreductase n=1 Tax=Aestuariibaculum marinum TaxID=2683592 RepID=A0A8J6Q089_9FLAO|nr:SDR family NAD(P)-dependent oxidoreductase [Aestuariibaculum marinum]MBD0825271.1 SDR family NAD(P)-dependent oxidoreductase [Aestuariibaculum marinum]